MAFSTSPVAMAVSRMESGVYLEVNEAFIETFGYDREEVIGRSSVEIGILTAHQREAMLSANAEGSVRNLEITAHAKGGRALHGLFSSEVIHLAGRDCLLAVFVDITERRQAEKALVESERRFRDTLRYLEEAFFSAALDGRILDHNLAFARIFGMSEEQVMVGLQTTDLWFNLGDREAYLKELLENGLVHSYPIHGKTLRGDRAWLNLSARIVWDKAGLPLRIEGTVTDVTERRKSEEALRESERRLRSVLENVSLIGVILDREGRITLCNDFLLDLTGWTRAEVLDRDWFEVFLPEDQRADVKAFHGAIIRTGTMPPYHDNDIVTRQGERRLVHWSNTVLRSAEGEIIGVASIGEDITLRQKAEDALRASEERFRTLVEQASDGIFISDPNGRFVDVNSAGCRLLDYTRDELLRLSVRDIVLHEDQSRYLEEARAGGVVISQRDLLRKDGSFVPVEISAKRMPDGCFQGIVRDLTQRLQMEASLAQADRLASLGLLVAGVAHEINNPLAYVLFNLESLGEEIPLLVDAIRNGRGPSDPRPGVTASADMAILQSPRLERIVESIRDATAGLHRIRDTVRGLSSFSRVEQAEHTPIDLNSAVECAADMAFNEIKYRARLVRDYGSLPTVMASEGKLSQVFLNLLINAVQAIGDGEADRNIIGIRTWSEGPDVFAEVSDTGSGIRPEHLGLVFDPFFTTRGGKGSGLGLAISRNVISEFGGEIRVDSQVGKGARFTIRLPAATSLQETPPPPVVVAQPLPAARGRVLLVDDEEGIRKTLSRFLEKDHDIVTAVDGREAQSILDRDRAFDLILCDLMMPNMDGMDLHAWLMERAPDLARQMVFFTGGAFTPRAASYMEALPNLRFEKPFNGRLLKKVVADLVTEIRGRGR